MLSGATGEFRPFGTFSGTCRSCTEPWLPKGRAVRNRDPGLGVLVATGILLFPGSIFVLFKKPPFSVFVARTKEAAEVHAGACCPGSFRWSSRCPSQLHSWTGGAAHTPLRDRYVLSAKTCQEGSVPPAPLTLEWPHQDFSPRACPLEVLQAALAAPGPQAAPLQDRVVPWRGPGARTQ